MSIEFFLVSLSQGPLMIEDLCLLLQVHVVIQGIVVELRVCQSLLLGLKLVALLENIHDLNDCLHHVLLEYFLHDDNCDVEVELLDDLADLFFGQAVANEVGSKVLVLSVEESAESGLTSCEQLDHSVENSVEIEDLHFFHQKQLDEASDSDHVILGAKIIFSFGDIF